MAKLRSSGSAAAGTWGLLPGTTASGGMPAARSTRTALTGVPPCCCAVVKEGHPRGPSKRS